MEALGKTLAACTLAFGSLAGSWGGGSAWHDDQASHSQNDKDDSGSGHASYDDKEWKTGQKFYQLSWDKQQKLCSDDHYWNMWSQKVGYDDEMRDKFCAEQWDDEGGMAWVKDDGHDKKDWNKGDWNKDHDRNQETAYHKSETAAQYYSAQSQEHEKQAVALEASSHQTEDSDKSYGDWGSGHDDGGQKSVDSANYTVVAEHEKQAAASVEAAQVQTTVINNYNYINGDNNVINNNISVANMAAAQQTATSSESTAIAVEANQASSDEGWNGDDSSSDASLKYAAISEKSSSSSVTTASAYQLEESYSQTTDNGHDWDKSNYDSWNEGWQQDDWKSDCPPTEHDYSYREGSSDCE